jgi:hypothetical protein
MAYHVCNTARASVLEVSSCYTHHNPSLSVEHDALVLWERYADQAFIMNGVLKI